MYFSSLAIALGVFEIARCAVIEHRQVGTCTPGVKLANYNDLHALPVDDGNTGLTSNFNPYLDLNYTRFSVVSTGAPNDSGLFYSLSQISSGPLAGVQAALAAILGSTAVPLPSILAAPRIIGSTSRTRFEIRTFQFGCSIRSGGSATVIPFPCQIIVRPTDPLSAGLSSTCNYNVSPTGPAGLQTCTVNLPISRGFTFQTVAQVSSQQLTQIQSLVNAAAEVLLVTAFDNLLYLETCSIL
ncbi:hypothetical protein SUNI508_06462 [Seiridium unicorne]|uniref:Uncharacterized protein n=1 Tax=Seiridium unicorne TaxID=138068 RepID=A0ABR2V0U4_9PEZI